MPQRRLGPINANPRAYEGPPSRDELERALDTNRHVGEGFQMRGVEEGIRPWSGPRGTGRNLRARGLSPKTLGRRQPVIGRLEGPMPCQSKPRCNKLP